MSATARRTRRDALKATFALLAGFLVARPARSHPVDDEHNQPKIDRARVRYADAQGPNGKHCGNCMNYIAPDHCRLVEGEISPSGHCLAYAPKEDVLF